MELESTTAFAELWPPLENASISVPLVPLVEEYSVPPSQHPDTYV